MSTVVSNQFMFLTALLVSSVLIGCGSEASNDSSEDLLAPVAEPSAQNSTQVPTSTAPTTTTDNSANDATGATAPSSTAIQTEAGDATDNEMNAAVDADPTKGPTPQDERGLTEIFGAQLSDDIEFVPFEDLITEPEAYAGRPIQTEGTVRQACQKRGCWMEIRDLEDPTGESITVKFLDYGFFVPVDSRGSDVLIEGITAVTTLTAEEVQELVAEGYDPGIIQEDGTATLIRFTASGVLMWNRGDE